MIRVLRPRESDGATLRESLFNALLGAYPVMVLLLWNPTRSDGLAGILIFMIGLAGMCWLAFWAPRLATRISLWYQTRTYRADGSDPR